MSWHVVCGWFWLAARCGNILDQDTLDCDYSLQEEFPDRCHVKVELTEYVAIVPTQTANINYYDTMRVKK